MWGPHIAVVHTRSNCVADVATCLGNIVDQWFQTYYYNDDDDDDDGDDQDEDQTMFLGVMHKKNKDKNK